MTTRVSRLSIRLNFCKKVQGSTKKVGGVWLSEGSARRNRLSLGGWAGTGWFLALPAATGASQR